MICERCSQPLRYGTRYCSRACAGLAKSLPLQTCAVEACGRQYAPWRLTQRYCSLSCAASTRPTPVPPVGLHGMMTSRAVLEILRASSDWPLTLSDLAIWIHGDDSPADIQAVRMNLYHLRQWGYVFGTTTVTWLPISHGVRLAYRLLSSPLEVAA